MDVIINRDGDILNIKLIGRFDTLTSPEVEKKVLENINGISKMIFDCKELEYISSAGLRVLLLFTKKVEKDCVILRDINTVVSDIIKVLGFNNVLKIE